MNGLEELEEMGPVDYLLVEWNGRQPNGELAPRLIDLVDRGIIRILDLVFLAKDEDGAVGAIEIGEMPHLGDFEGASSGLVDEEDLAEAGAVMEPGTSAALLIYENVWAAPFAVAMRKSGGQVVSSGRIPIQQMLAALEAAEA
jgi:hypothetical protein